MFVDVMKCCWTKQKNENIFEKIHHKVYPDVILGFYTNYTSDFSLTSGYYSLIIGCPVSKIDDVAEGMAIKNISAGKYAVFTANGRLEEAVARVWLEEICQNKKIQRTFTNDFEWYDSKSTNDESCVVKIYISIK